MLGYQRLYLTSCERDCHSRRGLARLRIRSCVHEGFRIIIYKRFEKIRHGKKRKKMDKFERIVHKLSLWPVKTEIVWCYEGGGGIEWWSIDGRFWIGEVMCRMFCNRWVDSRRWIGRVAIENAVASLSTRGLRGRESIEIKWNGMKMR